MLPQHDTAAWSAAPRLRARCSFARDPAAPLLCRYGVFGWSCDCGVTSGMVLARPASIIASSFVSICSTRAVLIGDSTLSNLPTYFDFRSTRCFLHVEIAGACTSSAFGVGHRFEVLRSSP